MQPQNFQLKIALVGQGAKAKTAVADYLRKKRNFKMMRLDDGVQKFVRDMYYYQPHQRVVWEKRMDIYDALYKLDAEIHIGYLLRRLQTTTRDVVVHDARFINEVSQLKDAGFYIVRVSQPPNPRRQIHGLRNAPAGTVLLHETYRNVEAYTADYSIMGGDRAKLLRSIDNVVDNARMKLLESNQQEEPVSI